MALKVSVQIVWGGNADNDTARLNHAGVWWKTPVLSFACGLKILGFSCLTEAGCFQFSTIVQIRDVWSGPQRVMAGEVSQFDKFAGSLQKSLP